jgi:hypothetical protein
METFKVAGTSKLPTGETKVRFANDMTRVKVLVKGGHTDIDLIEMSREMTKEEIVEQLIKMDFANGNADKAAAIQAEAAKRRVGEYARPAAKEKAAPKAGNVTVVAKTRSAKPSKKSVKEQLGLTDEEMQKLPKSVLEDMEDAPF